MPRIPRPAQAPQDKESVTFSVLTDTGGRPSGHNDRMVTGADTDEWFTEVRPEWAGHTWASWSATNDSRLVAEAATWAGQPLGTLYLHASNLDRAYAAAVAIRPRLPGSHRRAEPAAARPADNRLARQVPRPYWPGRCRPDRRAHRP